MPVLTKEEILDYLREIKPRLQKDGIEKIGIFGSYAKGYADENSDIDVVVLANKERFLERLNAFAALAYLEDLKEEISHNFHKHVDMCDFYSEKRLQENKITTGAIYV